MPVPSSSSPRKRGASMVLARQSRRPSFVARIVATPPGVLLEMWLSRPQVTHEKLSRRVSRTPSSPCRSRKSASFRCLISSSLAIVGLKVVAPADLFQPAQFAVCNPGPLESFPDEPHPLGDGRRDRRCLLRERF